MKFAMNWSPEASELLAAGEIELDLFKCPNWEDLVADARAQLASYVHFPLTIGKGQYPEWDVDVIHNWLDTTETRFVNCHILPSKNCFDEDVSLDTLIPALIEEVQTLVDAFGAERVIIENCPYFIGNIEQGFLKQGTEPRIFHEIIEATGCGFLLDMAHAYMVADYLKLDFEPYIASLPVEHIREFHITGMGEWSTGIRGDHMPMTEPDWDRLNFCMRNFESGKWRKPDVIAFEYGGIGMLKDLCGSNKHMIATQVPRLVQLVSVLLEDEN